MCPYCSAFKILPPRRRVARLLLRCTQDFSCGGAAPWTHAPGGGKSITVQFVVASEKQAGLFDQIGIGFVSGNATEELQLVDDNGSAFVILIPPGNQATRVDKELVVNILYWTPG